jgi:hypothetical protein
MLIPLFYTKRYGFVTVSWYKREVFISRDGNFLKSAKRVELEKLGAGLILNPEEFLRKFNICRTYAFDRFSIKSS